MLRKLTTILGTCLIVIVGLCYFFLYNSTESKIKLNDKANVYFLTSEGIYTLVTEDNKINLLEKSEQKLAEFVYYYYPRASFDNRYLLFSKGWDIPSHPMGIVSIDFQTGKIHTEKTENIADGRSGSSANFFYTWANFTTESRLTQFDKNGREIQSKIFNETLILVPGQSDLGSNLQLIATKDLGEEKYEDYLITINENDLSIVSEEPVYHVDDKHYRFVNSATIDNTLYAPLHSIRDNITKELTLDSRLLIKDLTTGQSEFLELPEPFPMRMTYHKHYIFIEHNAIELGKAVVTVFNIDTQEIQIIDLSQLGIVEDVNSTFVDFFTFDKTGNLLFTVKNKLVYYNIETQSVLDVFDFKEDETPYYIWAVN